MKKWMMAVTVAAAVATLGAGRVHESAERKAVERAVLDYVEGIYEIRPEWIDRGVATDMAKRGFGRGPDGAYRESKMTFAQLRRLAMNWNARGRVDPKTAKKQVVILDMLDKTASVKLSAAWGVDYMHLAKYNGEWKIVNVLWQADPPAAQ